MTDLNALPLIDSAVKGADVLYMVGLFRKKNPPSNVLFVAENEKELSFVKNFAEFLNPKLPILSFSPWNTVPYDRTSPDKSIVSERIETLFKLSQGQTGYLILTTARALLQRNVPLSFFKDGAFRLKTGEEVNLSDLGRYLSSYGYTKVDKVFQQGEFSFRGNLADIFPAGQNFPVRLDLFGDEIESIKSFDVVSQRSMEKMSEVALLPACEILTTDSSLKHFRLKYRELFGVPSQKDAFYTALSTGVLPNGAEHFLPLFYDETVSFLSYLPAGCEVFVSSGAEDAAENYEKEIREFYDERVIAKETPSELESIYQPVPPEMFFDSAEKVWQDFQALSGVMFSPFLTEKAHHLNSQLGPVFALGRVGSKVQKQNVFEEVAKYLKKIKHKIVVCAYSEESASRILNGLSAFMPDITQAFSYEQALKKSPSVIIFPLEKGFTYDKVTFISESDIFGEKIQTSCFTKGKKQFIGDISSLSQGDLIVHRSHGIGQYIGLKTLQISGEKHDCIALLYAKGDKLFIPIENMDVLNKYGEERQGIILDTLGSQGWEARKGKLKKYILEMAEKLIALEAKRKLDTVPKIYPPTGLYDDFCARFPYIETRDQKSAISDVLNDLGKGVPMDRLVCGDVGFGKTEVALRAAFATAMDGGQVALIVPTTLLARQHFQNFKERFAGFPLCVEMLSRLVTPAHTKEVKAGLKNGSVNIVVGTHALLAKDIQFNNLSLLIVDEEHNFGVTHKERLKELKTGVHILTLTATPIPRTLQMALTGVRDLSLIATSPVDRLAVRTFIMPFDRVVLKEALLREMARGGQAFYVCPRISDLPALYDTLEKMIPEAKIAIAHGQMSPKQLEEIISDFLEKKYDILLSTTIIESGIDMPNVNTLIIHRADKFGLAQLYQLKGRVGRSKVRGYCYLTIPSIQKIGPVAERRLSVMQSLDSLGAGFSLASHDLDIRGAGNLLGQEQSGHIHDVGVELYQKMLEEAVFALRTGHKEEVEESYSPQISIDIPVLIPEAYLPDLSLRMELYHRISAIDSDEKIEEMKEEMKDRFGPLPREVRNLFQIVSLKNSARRAHIEKADVGPKGAVISFYQKTFPNPVRLIEYIQNQLGTVKLNADYKMTVLRSWDTPEKRLAGIGKLLNKLAELAL